MYGAADLSDPHDGYRFIIMFPAICRHENVCDQTDNYPDHDSVFTACDEMINIEMFFPPLEEFLSIPPEFVYQGDLLCCQIMTVSCNEIFCITNMITDYSDSFLSLTDTRGSEADRSIGKDMAVRIRMALFYTFRLCIIPDPTDKALSLIPESVRKFVALIPPIRNSVCSGERI